MQVEALREVLGKVAEPYREIAGYLDQLQTIAGTRRTHAMKTMIKNDEAAVSPVIATILMVAITVVLAAVLYVMVSGLITLNDKIAPIGRRCSPVKHGRGVD